LKPDDEVEVCVLSRHMLYPPSRRAVDPCAGRNGEVLIEADVPSDFGVGFLFSASWRVALD